MRAFRRLRSFHRDEKGLEALQVILIVAIAAIILALLKAYWQDVKNWFAVNVYPLFEFGND
jgi:hypothetical protein